MIANLPYVKEEVVPTTEEKRLHRPITPIVESENSDDYGSARDHHSTLKKLKPFLKPDLLSMTVVVPQLPIVEIKS